MKTKCILIALSISFGLALPALGQREVPVEPEAAEQIRYRKVTAITFTEVEMKGTLAGPSVSYQRVRTKKRFRSLIELRGHFKPELHRSIGGL